MKLTNRQKDVLKYIIEHYVETTEPVSSSFIFKKYFPNLSSQTIRIDMGALEKYELIEKIHTSSGRVPSIKGYNYYNEFIMMPLVDEHIVKKIETIFDKRYQDIDDVIKTSLDIINEVTGLISVSCDFSLNEETIKNINLVPIDGDKAVVIIVTNFGNTPKTSISFKETSQIKDIKVCIDIFNKYLIDVPFSKIESKLREIEPIIKREVQEYEFITQELISRMLRITLKNINQKNQQIVGLNSIFNNPEFKDHDKLQQFVNVFSEGNIWDLIKYDMEKNNIKNENVITKQYENLPISITSTSITIEHKKYSISVIGPNRIDNKKVFGVLECIYKKITELYKK